MRELACVKECLWGHITHSASALRQQPLLGAIVPHHSSNAKVHQLQGRIALARASLRTSQCRHIELAGSYSPLASSQASIGMALPAAGSPQLKSKFCGLMSL